MIYDFKYNKNYLNIPTLWKNEFFFLQFREKLDKAFQASKVTLVAWQGFTTASGVASSQVGGDAQYGASK